MDTKAVRVRFAPSPTGFLHIGSLRTTLYNWFFARKHGGTFILRIEDTDRVRAVPGATESLCRTLRSVGLDPDEGVRLVGDALVDEGPHTPYFQAARKDRHLAYAQELVEKGHAYYCFCTKERLERLSEEQRATKQQMMYDKHCRSIPREDAKQRVAAGEEHVIRLAIPMEGVAVMDDLIHGRIEIPWAQVDDQVLIKSDGFPTYHLAATCDDHDMEISHVIRGDEWISSLPKHVYIAQCFGWTPPQYAHLPLLLNPDRSKLSKRQGDVAVEDYLAKGYVPDALINFVALLGWNPTADREIFTKEELAELFDITRVNKAGAVLNKEKLDWLNNHYLRALSDGAYLETCRPWVKDVMADAQMKDRACLIVRERLVKLADLPELIGYLFVDSLAYDSAILCWKKQTREEALERLQALRVLLGGMTEDTFAHVEMLDQEIRAFIVAKGWGNGDTLWPLRVALSGREKSPSPFELLFVYGKTLSLQRLDEAIARLA